MTKLEALAKDCIENHTHRLIDRPSKQDIYTREESIYISGYKECERQNKNKIAELERKLEQTEKDLTDYQFNYPKIKDLEKENGKLLQKIAQLEKDVTENESDCSMCDFPKLKQDLEEEKCELLGIIQGKDTAIQDLQKENAELKKRVENQKSFLERIRAKFELGEIERKEIEGYLESEQLIEAKEIIDAFLDFESSCQERGIYISDEMREKANKFLEEE